MHSKPQLCVAVLSEMDVDLPLLETIATSPLALTASCNGRGWGKPPLESLVANVGATLEWPLRNAKHKFEINSLSLFEIKTFICSSEVRIVP